MAKPNREVALDAIKRTGGFSESEKDALINAFRQSMFPGNWSTGTPDDGDTFVYDAGTDTWEFSESATTFLALTDTPDAYNAGRFVKVKNTGDAVEFVAFSVTYDPYFAFADLNANHNDILYFDLSIGGTPGLDGWVSGPLSDIETISSVNGQTGDVVLDIDDVTPTTTKGDIIVEDGTNAIRLALGTDGHVLTADSAQPSGVKWAASPAGFGDPMTTRGDIIYKNAAGTTTRLPAGSANQVLTSDGTDIAWQASVAGVSVFTALTDTPSSYSGNANKYVRVNAAADALEFVSTTPVTQVTASSPMASSGGTTPNLTIQAATAAQHGYMSSTYALKLDGIEAGADVTDAINVAAAGAYMKNVTVSSSAPSGGSDGDVWYQVA